nr:chloroplast envelope membrane protein [Trochiscia hystrix]
MFNLPKKKPLSKMKQGNINKSNNVSKNKSVVSVAYEELGLFPRSFIRVFDRFVKQLFSDVENLVIEEYRFYRFLFLTTIKCLFLLIFVPFFVNFMAKTYLVRPLTEYYWNTKQPEIFLNSYQQKTAFSELQKFEEILYFESLITPNCEKSDGKQSLPDAELETKLSVELRKLNMKQDSCNFISKSSCQLCEAKIEQAQQRLQKKTLELAVRYNTQSIEAITNIVSDFISFLTLCFLIFSLQVQINITKSFLFEVFFALDDTQKSVSILFITDLLVGYHSPNLWEFFFSSIFSHYGLPESETSVFLLVATLPVLLDVLFKYLIFRHLNRASPGTVATYHALIE